MIDLILGGAMLGLSTGVFCLAGCAPVFVPYLMAEKRTLARNLCILGELAIGRLAAYLLVGLVIGILASRVESGILHRAAGAALIAVSVLLLIFVLSGHSPEFPACRFLTAKAGTVPLLFGFLTGVNVCPPFLLAISAAAATGTIVGSILVFAGFFCGTSLYLLVLLPAGFAGNYPAVRTIGKMTAVLSGIVFLIVGILYLL